MKRRHALAGVASLAIATRRAVAQSLVTIRVSSTANDDVTPIVYAQNSGAFRAAGLDVVFQKANNGSAVAAAVAGGAIDIGKSSVIPVIKAYSRGIPFVAVAPSVLHHDHSLDSGLIVAVDGPRTARELNGSVCAAAALQDTTWLAARTWIDDNGGDSSSIHFLEIPGSAIAVALVQHRIAAGTISQPFLTQAVDDGKARLLANVQDAIALRSLSAFYFSTVDYVARNTESVARFRRVIGESSAYCNAHQAETIPMMAAFTGIEPQVLRTVTRAYFATDLDPRDLQPTIDAAARYKVIDKTFDARNLIAAR
jgi:ABC-type nitrate/sulfonate/bicarbonate transport system substrate-binding protein